MNQISNINGSNSVALDDLRKAFLADVREFGRDSAAGKDSLPKLAVRVVKAAADGIINYTDPKAKKLNDGPDDAELAYTSYVEAESKKAIHEHSDGGKKANISKLRKLIQFGCSTVCDPMDVMNRTVIRRSDLAEAGGDVKGAYPAYVDVARAQIANDRDLTDEQIDAAIVKAPAKEKDVIDVLKSVEKILDQLITGEHKAGQDQSVEVIQAHESVRARIAAMGRASDLEAFKAKAAELGYAPMQAAE
jgi:hypothetical protein